MSFERFFILPWKLKHSASQDGVPAAHRRLSTRHAVEPIADRQADSRVSVQADTPPLPRRADLYSLGVLLYQMIAGRLPFEAETPTAISPFDFPLQIGRSRYWTNRPFTGAIDEVAVFDNALSEVEILSLYQHGRAGGSLHPDALSASDALGSR